MNEYIKDISFDDIFNLYYPRCILFATKLLGNRWDAEEAVQELFINLWAKGKLDTINGSVKSYLFKSVFNICIDVQRKNKVKQKNETDAPEGWPGPGIVNEGFTKDDTQWHWWKYWYELMMAED